MAFLHRVVNGGGSLEREYAIGSGRMDLCLRCGAATLGMELKVWRDSAARTSGRSCKLLRAATACATPWSDKGPPASHRSSKTNRWHSPGANHRWLRRRLRGRISPKS